jgi:hypothetical protein
MGRGTRGRYPSAIGSVCQGYFGGGHRAFGVICLRRQNAALSFVVKGGGKRKSIPLQTNEGQPFLLGSQPYGVGFGVGGGTLDSNEVVDLG